MSGDDEPGGEVEPGSDEEPSGEVEPAPVADCPRCGDPVGFAVVTGPQSGTVEPCGCGVPTELLDRIREDDRSR